MSYLGAVTGARLVGSWTRICRLMVLSIAAAGGIVALAEGHPDHPRHPRPLKGQDVVCSECLTPNGGLLTAGFNDPLFSYAGRYMDSANTRNIQNVGMRTLRAQRVRVAGDRIYIEYGETIVAFAISRFFHQIAEVSRMRRVGAIAKGDTKRAPDPDEWMARPETFFYPEAAASGWELPAITPFDGQETINDFDVDGNGNVYAGTKWWGWGIAWDFVNTAVNARHMEFRCRLAEPPMKPNAVIALTVNGSRYAVVAAEAIADEGVISQIVYAVNDVSAPAVQHTRLGKTHGIQFWSRYDPTQRVAVMNADDRLRIYTYNSFLQPAPVAIDIPELAQARNFRQVSFDENGTLWAIEATGKHGSGNRLWRMTPHGTGYTVEHYDVLGTFAPEKIAARNGYLAIGGMRPGSQTELRLYRVRSTGVELVDTGNFFFRYYHAKGLNDGYATGASYEQAYTSLYALHLLEYEGKLYLLYSANGLGDVYEIREQIPTTITLTASPDPAPFGSTVTLTATLSAPYLGPSPPSGTLNFTRDGVAIGSMPLTASGATSYTAVVTNPGLSPGTYTYGVSYAGNGTYKAGAATPHVLEIQHVLPVIDAVAEDSGVRVTWTPVPGIQYDVLRTAAGNQFPSLSRVSGGEYLDTDVLPGNFYRYTVNAVYPNGLFGPQSLPDVASTFAFSDPNLPAGTIAKAAHIFELRTAVNALRQLAGLPEEVFQDVPASGMTIRAAHVTELQVAALPACNLLGIGFLPGVVPAPQTTAIGRTEVLALRGIVE